MATQGERTVWVIGEPIEAAASANLRYHAGGCYVLDQTPHLGRARKIRLADLSEAYTPCQICAPGRRTASRSAGPKDRSGVRAPGGAKLGQVVEFEDVAGESVETRRLVETRSGASSNEVSVNAPLGAALLGRAPGDIVEVKPPSGRSRTLRVLRVSDPE